jgi:hypothetical protein
VSGNGFIANVKSAVEGEPFKLRVSFLHCTSSTLRVIKNRDVNVIIFFILNV